MPSALNLTFAQQEEKFVAILNGSEVSPPVSSDATGKAEFILYREQPIRLLYKVSVSGIDSNINNITGVHLHNGIRDFNGTTIKELPVIKEHERNGVLAVGNITGSDNFSSELSGKGELAISSLIHYIDNDEVYLDIHTVDNPRGELRGQVSRLP